MAETIDTLQQRWRRNLAWVDGAVQRHRTSYHELKRLVQRILNGPIEIGEYADLAKRLTRLIMELKEDRTDSVWDYYAANLDPGKQGRAFQMRAICKDLQHFFTEIDQFRLDRRGLKIIK